MQRKNLSLGTSPRSDDVAENVRNFKSIRGHETMKDPINIILYNKRRIPVNTVVTDPEV
jgi:hypothetical protein